MYFNTFGARPNVRRVLLFLFFFFLEEINFQESVFGFGIPGIPCKKTPDELFSITLDY